jgi:phosphoglycolate phosphatase-like HAD superfamily hydrolase
MLRNSERAILDGRPQRAYDPSDAGPVAVLFDVDGTLISTGGAGTRSWRWAFDKLHGVAADIGEHSEAGMTDPVVAKSTFRSVIGRAPTERELARLLAAYLERLPVEVGASEHYRVLPGAGRLLRRLSDGGILLGIVTGALEAASRAKLSRAGFNPFFTFGGYGSDSDHRTELTRLAIERAGAILGRRLGPASVYVVGDTPRDVGAAHGADAVAVGVATGRYSVEDLSEAGADIVMASLEEPMPGLEWT